MQLKDPPTKVSSSHALELFAKSFVTLLKYVSTSFMEQWSYGTSQGSKAFRTCGTRARSPRCTECNMRCGGLQKLDWRVRQKKVYFYEATSFQAFEGTHEFRQPQRLRHRSGGCVSLFPLEFLFASLRRCGFLKYMPDIIHGETSILRPFEVC